MVKLPFFGKNKSDSPVANQGTPAPAGEAVSNGVQDLQINPNAASQSPQVNPVPVMQPTPAPQTSQADKKSLLERHREVKLAQQAFDKGMINVLDYIAPSAFSVAPTFIQLENLYAKTLFVYSYARYVNTNWLSRIVNLDIQVDISMFIYPLATGDVMSALRRKLTQLGATETIQREKGQVRDPELETAIGDIEQLRDALSRGEGKLFQYGLYFTVYHKDKEELEILTKQLEANLGGLLIYTKQALMRMEQGFSSSMPLANDELMVTRNLDTASLSTTFPFVSSTLSSDDGIFYGINLHNSSLVLFDRFSLENANSVIFATSGAGKSFTVKLEALRYLMWGTDVIVIDPENEYQRLSQAVGGTFLSMSLNSKERINPFDLPIVNGGDERGEDILRTAVVSIKSLVGIMVGGLTPEEDAILDKAVYETYAIKDITADIRTHKNEPPLMIDLQNVLNNMTGAENLTRKLTKFTEGTFAGLFNQPTNIDLNKGFVVFSIRDLEEQLRPIAMFLVLNFIWNKARFETRKRLVMVDEAWMLMKHKDAAEFLFSLAKRARKYFVGMTVITQDVEDFITSSQGRAIVNNAAMRILLKQSAAAVDQLADIFKLTQGEKMILREAKVGQGIFFAGSNHVAIEIIASYEEQRLITTNPAELLKMQQQAEAQAAASAAASQSPVAPSAAPSAGVAGNQQQAPSQPEPALASSQETSQEVRQNTQPAESIQKEPKTENNKNEDAELIPVAGEPAIQEVSSKEPQVIDFTTQNNGQNLNAPTQSEPTNIPELPEEPASQGDNVEPPSPPIPKPGQ